MNCTFATELIRAPLAIAVANFDTHVESAAPGSDGLLVLPFFNGERTPNLPDGKGCILGLDAGNTRRGHLLRATVEGTTFAVKFGIDELAALGLAGDEIVLTGGGANSRAWRQIVADITGLPVTVLDQNEGAGFGAALQALWSLERQSDAAVSIGDVIAPHIRCADAKCATPDAQSVDTYATIYERYQRAVARIAPLFPF
jgi:xylulokinase